MVRTVLLSTHAHMYTQTHMHKHTTTNILLAASNTVPWYDYTKDAILPLYRTKDTSLIILKCPCYAYARTRLHGIRVPCEGSIPPGDSRQVGTASRPLFCFGLSTVHYIDKDNDISFFIFQYVATR